MRRARILIALAVPAACVLGIGARFVRTSDGDPVLRTVDVGASPWAAAADPAVGRVFVVNRSSGSGAFSGSSGFGFGAGSVTVLDAQTGEAIRSSPVGPDPRAIAVDARAHRVFVTNDDGSSVSVLDARTGLPLATTQVGARPHAVAVDARTGRIFVANTGDRTLSILAGARASVARTLHLAAASDRAVAVADSRSGRLFIGDAQSIAMLDSRTGKIVATTALGADATPLEGQSAVAMAVDEAAGRLYALTGASLVVLDAANGHLLDTLVIKGRAAALALDNRRHRILIAIAGGTPSPGGYGGYNGYVGYGGPTGSPGVQENGTVQVLDARTRKIIRTFAVGVAPSAIAVDPAAARAFVVDSGGQVRRSDPWGWIPENMRKHLTFLPGPLQTRTTEGSVTVVDLSRL